MSIEQMVNETMKGLITSQESIMNITVITDYLNGDTATFNRVPNIRILDDDRNIVMDLHVYPKPQYDEDYDEVVAFMEGYGATVIQEPTEVTGEWYDVIS